MLSFKPYQFESLDLYVHINGVFTMLSIPLEKKSGGGGPDTTMKVHAFIIVTFVIVSFQPFTICNNFFQLSLICIFMQENTLTYVKMNS